MKVVDNLLIFQWDKNKFNWMSIDLNMMFTTFKGHKHIWNEEDNMAKT